ncbi:sodium:calcium antiporter [Nanoarchaeota archaeon]
MAVLIILLLLMLAIILIWKGSDWITDSLVPVANRLGTGYIAITTLMVSFLLSIPEVFTTVYSYILGHLDVGLGVVLGSVMMNIGLVAGLSAAIKPLNVERSVVVRDGVFLIIIAVVVLLFGSDLHYSRPEGIVLLLLYIPYALNVWSFEKWRPHKSKKEKIKKIKESLNLIGELKIFKFKPSVLTFFLGGGMLIIGSYLFSLALVNLSKILPLPGILVGLIFGAIGTGIPNIVAAVQGTIKGFEDVAITETFGSNVFTLLIALGVIIVLQPFSIVGKLFYFDMTWMIIMHLLLIALIFKGYRYKEESLTRYEGVALVLFYLVIVVINVVVF